jgi:hypothetical protein
MSKPLDTTKYGEPPVWAMAKLEQEIDRLRAAYSRAVDVVRSAEWMGRDKHCVWCDEPEHGTDCALAAVLREAEEVS